MTQVHALDVPRRPALVYGSLVALAVLAWGPILLTPTAFYWDDWAIVANSDTLQWAREMGLPWIGPIFVAIAALGPWAFKVLAILVTIVVGSVVYAVSGRGLGLSWRERWLLAALVVVLPLYGTRATAILSFYEWSIAAFFVGWYLLVRKSPDQPGRLRYVAATALLLFSYTAASLLPFTAVPVAHLALLAIDRTQGFWRGVLRFAARFWYVLAAPVVFWVVRTLFLQPHGLYEEYNSIRLFALDFNGLGSIGLMAVILFTVALLVYSFLGRRPRREWLRRGLILGLLGLSVGAIAVFLYIARISTEPYAVIVPATLGLCAVILCTVAVVGAVREHRSATPATLEVIPMLAVGIITLALAMLPYMLVNKLPSWDDWEARHQLLMPLGVAIIIVSAVRAVASFVAVRPVTIAVGALVALFTLTSAFMSVALVVDWKKQEQIIAAISTEPLIESASTVLFVDEAQRLSFDQRPYTFYEYTGWFGVAFGDKSRLGIDRSAVGSYLDGEYDLIFDAPVRYGVDDFVPSDDAVVVTIRPVDGASWLTLLRGEPSLTLTVEPVADLATLR